MTKLPRLCASTTVRTAASIRAARNSGATPFTLSIAAGRYWFDPVYAGHAASDSISAVGRLTYALDTADAGNTYVCAYNSYILTELQKSINGWTGYLTPSTTNFQLMPTDAITTDAGRAFLRAWGLPTNQTIPYATLGLDQWLGSLPIWDPVYGEAGNVREYGDGFAALFKTRGRGAYALDLGQELPRRFMEFQMLPGGTVNQARSRGVFGDNGEEFGTSVGGERVGDYSLQWIWRELLSRGELVRYYADRTATATFITAACSATATSITVSSAAGLTANNTIWLDGELMMITSVLGSVLTVERSEPVAHPIYAPVSRDFVGTYALDESGGDVSLRSFTPRQRTVRADFWDLSIPLVRAVWS